ncbi:MAG: trypsin-like peptidase domain-containing protein [Fimbriimonadaceae bacterium]|nr:trypsin-like peptidase domain-containing protein [Fimbriimonadaceae bacterium]
MKGLKSAVLAAGSLAAVFAVVFGAIQLDRFVRHRPTEGVTFATPPGARLINASTEGAIGFDFREPARKALESVVSIQTTASGEDFFGRRVVQPYAEGSGVVVSTDGYIVTNNHVVRLGSPKGPLADAVSVTFSDGKAYEARIVGTDRRSDLAVLKIDNPSAKALALGDSSKLQPGEWVLAVGNPLGFSNTVSLGIVSSTGRPLQGDDALFVDGIQTDAAINQGNSGGALVDAQGNLVGINTAIASTNGGSIGIGFAIPVNRVKEVVRDIVKDGRVRYGDPGLVPDRRAGLLQMSRVRRQIQRLTNAADAPPAQGVIVADVLVGGPAARAGIHQLDILLSLDGQALASVDDYNAALTTKRPGDTVVVKYWSAGEVKQAKVTLTESSD